jgi:hypothetical protein
VMAVRAATTIHVPRMPLPPHERYGQYLAARCLGND